MAPGLSRAFVLACCLHAVAAAKITKIKPEEKQNFLAPAENTSKKVTLDGAQQRRIRGVCMMGVCALHEFPWTGCINQCQSAMATCVATKGNSACEGEVPKSMEGATSSGQWLARKQDPSDKVPIANWTMLMLRHIEDQCTSACGADVDSSCVPECQVRMYTCLDYDRKVPEGKEKYEECVADTISTYGKFQSQWDATHPYFLASCTGRHASATELERMQDKCTDACGKGVDSSCVPECQVKMYSCLDNDRKTKEGAEKYDKCEAKVLEEYKAFGQKWEETHPYLLVHKVKKVAISASDIDDVYQQCEAACTADADSSCVPECQVEMYTCFDNDRKTTDGASKYSECVKKNLDKYKQFTKEWNATSPYFIAQERKIATSKVKDECTAACGDSADSSCVVECQVKMYICLDNDRKTEEGAKMYEECTSKAIAEYKEFAANWDKTHPYLLSLKHKTDAKSLEAIQTGCTAACGENVDSSCVPECQVKMYTCLDNDRKTKEGAAEYAKCEEKVLAKYEEFADSWEKTHPYLLAVRKHTSAAQLEAMAGECKAACGEGVDSSCVPECQVQMYSCLDNDQKVPEGAAKYKECKDAVIAKYKAFAADWDAVHPY